MMATKEEITALVRQLETPFECYSIEMAKEDIVAAASMLREIVGMPRRYRRHVDPPNRKRLADLGQRIDACMARHGMTR